MFSTSYIRCDCFNLKNKILLTSFFTDDPSNWVNWLFGLITVFGPSNLVWDIRIRNFNFWPVHCFIISDPDGRIVIQFPIWEVDVCCYFLTLISSLRCPASLISQTPVTTWPGCASITSMSNDLSLQVIIRMLGLSMSICSGTIHCLWLTDPVWRTDNIFIK